MPSTSPMTDVRPVGGDRWLAACGECDQYRVAREVEGVGIGRRARLPGYTAERLPVGATWIRVADKCRYSPNEP